MSNEVKHCAVLPTSQEREDFLVRVYFGHGCGDRLLELVSLRAYRDPCRTLTGVSEMPNNQGQDGLRNKAVAKVKEKILELRDSQ